jgi:hypothetical protein
MYRVLLTCIATCLLTGCVGERLQDRGTAEETTNEMRFVFNQEGNRPPMLSTNEVMQLAWERAQQYRRDITNYLCDFLCFAGDTTNRSLSNRWIVHFRPNQSRWELHSDFFVDVDDSTKTVNLLHH